MQNNEIDDFVVELDLTEKFQEDPMFDQWIVEHHFTPYLRDYDVIVDVVAPLPNNKQYVEGRYRYRFTHCVLAEVTTGVTDSAWQKSWDDALIDHEIWQKAGKPDGYLWAVCVSLAYPGLSYLPGSRLSREWSERLGKPMNEVFIETNGHNIRLVFHDVSIRKIAQGNPKTRELTPIDDENMQ